MVSGHIHHACIQEVGSITYVNTGDFVEIMYGTGRTFRRIAGNHPGGRSCLRSRAALSLISSKPLPDARAVATDASIPQVNGVVFSLDNIARAVGRQGGEISFITPSDFPTLPLPSLPGNPSGDGKSDRFRERT